VFYRPLLIWSYGVEARLGGAQPAVFHAIEPRAARDRVRSCVRAARRVRRERRARDRPRADLLAHPASALVAAWIPCRNESLLAIRMHRALLASSPTSARAPHRARRVRRGLRRGAVHEGVGVALLAVLAASRRCCAAVGPTRRGALVAAGRRRARADARLGAPAPRGARPLAGRTRAMAPEPDCALVVPRQDAVPDRPRAGAGSRRHPALARRSPRSLLCSARRGARRTARPGGARPGWCRLFLAPARSRSAQTWGLEHRVYLPLVGLLLFAAQSARESARASRAAARALAVRGRARFAIHGARACPTSPTRSPTGRARRARRRTRRSPHRAWHGATTRPALAECPRPRRARSRSTRERRDVPRARDRLTRARRPRARRARPAPCGRARARER
jgi:hypothetical protein